MPRRLRAVAEREIGAAPDLVYQVIADYQNGHSRILPSACSGYAVEEGGVGTGTVHRVTVTLGGQSQTFRMRVDEPEPGRVLRETEIDGSTSTIFTVDAYQDGCRVRIETSWDAARGFSGLLDHLFGRHMVRRVLEDQLVLLDRQVRI
jgi:hypothetical protein